MFKVRSHKSELLDRLDSDANVIELHKNLKEFQFFNRWFGSHKTVITALEKTYQKYSHIETNRALKIIDLGCGGGDVLLTIQRWAQRNNKTIDLLGVDSQKIIVDYAKKNTKQYPNIRIEQLDIFSEAFKNKRFDIVCLNNVCHHFSDEQMIQLITCLKAQTQLAIVINDLQRNPIAYFFCKWMTQLLRFSAFAKHDGPLSILKAFQIQDLRKYMLDSRTRLVDIKKTWAFRWQVIIWCQEN